MTRKKRIPTEEELALRDVREAEELLRDVVTDLLVEKPAITITEDRTTVGRGSDVRDPMRGGPVVHTGRDTEDPAPVGGVAARSRRRAVRSWIRASVAGVSVLSSIMLLAIYLATKGIILPVLREFWSPVPSDDLKMVLGLAVILLTFAYLSFGGRDRVV